MAKSYWTYYCRLLSALIFTGVIVPAATRAEDAAKPTSEKWRQKNGVYALVGKDFAGRCENSGDFSVELEEKRITGDEWSCQVKKLTDTGPNALRLDLVCSDVNLEAAIPKPDPSSEEVQFEEMMTFRKIDEKFFFIRKSQNGKTHFPESKVAYCPPKAQRAYLELRKK